MEHSTSSLPGAPQCDASKMSREDTLLTHPSPRAGAGPQITRTDAAEGTKRTKVERDHSQLLVSPTGYREASFGSMQELMHGRTESASVSLGKRASYSIVSRAELVQLREEASQRLRSNKEQQLMTAMNLEDTGSTDSDPYGEKEDPTGQTALDFTSLCGIPIGNPVRAFVYHLTRHRAFEAVVLLVIVFNCSTLAFDDPRQEPTEFQVISEIVCNGFFTAEMILKVFSDGFIYHNHSYMRSPWNRLDFFIVIIGWIALVPTFGNYTGVRIVRVMRPLRSINGIQGLKNIVNALLLSVRGLMHVLLLIIFFFTIFGILGVQLFKGKYRRRCVMGEGLPPPPDAGEGQFCAKSSAHVLLGRTCPAPLQCLDYRNPEYGFNSFDNIGWAALVIFRCITLEGWVTELYRVMDLQGVIALCYFIPVVVFGAFFTLNLALAVVSERFSWTNEVQATKRIKEAITKIIEEDDRREMAANNEDIEKGRDSADVPEALTTRQVTVLRVRAAGRRVIESGLFQWAIVLFIFINTAFLAVEYDGQSAELSLFLNYANVVLTGIFAAEMSVKIAVFGLGSYVSDTFNILDGSIVLISLVDVFVDSSSGVTVFRALRLLRVLKLIKNFNSLRQLVSVLLHAVADTGFMNVLIFLYLYIAALVGTQLYSGYFDPEILETDGVPRSNFETFYWSWLTVFQILTRDNWTVPMWHAMKVRSPAACLYFVSLVLVGDFLILNLFLAILINSFDSNMNRDCDDDSDMLDNPEQLVLRLREVLEEERKDHIRHERSSRGSVIATVARRSRIASIGSSLHNKRPPCSQGEEDSRTSETSVPGSPNHAPSKRLSVHVYTASGVKLGGALKAYAKKTIQHQREWPATNGGNSLMIFGPSNWFRIVCTFIVNHTIFERIILMSIAASSILLAAEDPKQDLGVTHPLYISNLGFTALFCLEMALKLVAFGLIRGEGAYLRDGWNILDSIVVTISLLSLVLTSFDVVKVFRTLRTLRPLRVVNRNLGLKIVVRSLLRSMPQVANVAVVVSLIFFVFAILGVQLFGGKLNYCTDTTITDEALCVGFRADIYVPGKNTTLQVRRWRQQQQHFDNIYHALITLWEVSSLEMWSVIMYNTIDGHSKGKGPRRDATPLAGIYFMTFITFGSFFVLNLFVGVVIYNYNLEKKMMEGRGLLSPEQERWIEMQRLMLTFRPVVKMPFKTRGVRRYSCAIANSKTFEFTVYTMILVNVAVMGLEHDGSSVHFDNTLNTINYACSGFFFLEAIIKVHAWRMTYFRNHWNRYDMLLVIVSVGSLPYELMSSGDSYVTMFKLFRILRVMRLLKSSRGMRLLLETLWYSLPYLSNIFLFLGLVFFIYATLGVAAFHSVRRDEFLTVHTNFDSFPTAVLVLFRVSTGEDWNGIMHELMVSPPDCTPIMTDEEKLLYITLNNKEPPPPDCGPAMWVAPLYFISFICISAQVMLNLFIAVILDNFSTTVHVEKSKVGTGELNRFVSIWSDFDPDADLLVPTSRFPELLARLGPPLGVNDESTRMDLLHASEKFQIPEHGGVIHFVEVLIPLARLGMGVELSDDELREQEHSWRDDFPDILKLPTLRYRQRRVTVNQFFAATYIAAAYRRSITMKSYLPRRNAQRLRIAQFWLSLHTREASTQTDDPYEELKAELRRKRKQQQDIDEGLEKDADEARDVPRDREVPTHDLGNQEEGFHTRGVSSASGGAVSGVSTVSNIPLTVSQRTSPGNPRDFSVKRVDL